jgi:hypothetical protein
VDTLEAIFGELGRTIMGLPGPDSAEAQTPFKLDSSNLPVLPSEIADPNLIISATKIQYLPGVRGDFLEFLAEPATYGRLGLLALAVLFDKNRDSVRLNLTNPGSSVKYLCLEFRYYSEEGVSGYRTRPWTYGYVTEDIDSSYSPMARIPSVRRPVLRLTNLNDSFCTEQDWDNRDTVKGFGTGEGTAAIAEVFLNLSIPANAERVFYISNFLQRGSLGPFSAEVYFWKPQSHRSLHESLKKADIWRPG